MSVSPYTVGRCTSSVPFSSFLTFVSLGLVFIGAGCSGGLGTKNDPSIAGELFGRLGLARLLYSVRDQPNPVDERFGRFCDCCCFLLGMVLPGGLGRINVDGVGSILVARRGDRRDGLAIAGGFVWGGLGRRDGLVIAGGFVWGGLGRRGGLVIAGGFVWGGLGRRGGLVVIVVGFFWEDVLDLSTVGGVGDDVLVIGGKCHGHLSSGLFVIGIESYHLFLLVVGFVGDNPLLSTPRYDFEPMRGRVTILFATFVLLFTFCLGERGGNLLCCISFV